MTEDEMVGGHHRLNGHEFGWILGVGDGQGGLACYDSWPRTSLQHTGFQQDMLRGSPGSA